MKSAIVWRLEKAGEGVALVQESESRNIPQPQPDGFFTSVSSNGNSDAVIWAISRPMSRAHPEVDLLAFDAKDASQVLFSRRAGTWPNTTGKANLVPVVADGRVLVASYRELDIFAPGGNEPEPAAQLALQSFGAARINTGEKVISGVVEDVGKDRLTIIDRSSNKIQVEIPADFQSQTQMWQQSDTKGEAIKVTGVVNPADGSLRAKSILRAPKSPGLWAPDQ
jgi:hypothetical protein